MKTKFKLVILIFVCVLGCVYYFLFYKNNNLKFIPYNTDAVLIMDIKNIQNHYLKEILKNPTAWKFNIFTKDDDRISILNSGIEIPYFIQVFHLKNTSFATWFSIFELNDSEKFLQFLKQEKFINKGKNIFQKDDICIKINTENCLISYNSKMLELEKLNKYLSNKNSFTQNVQSTQYLTNYAAGSFVFLDKNIKPIQIYFNRNTILFDNNNENLSKEFTKFYPNIFELNFNTDLLEKTKIFYNKYADLKFIDSLHLNNIHAEIHDVKQVKDSIITYNYDDNFNETKEVSFQKILQPLYSVTFSTENSKNLMDYFTKNEWINNKNQFVKIPFQPNFTTVSSNNILISTEKIAKGKVKNSAINYFFFTNSNTYLWNELHFLSMENKKKITFLESIHFINKNNEYFLKIQFKENNLPWILEL